MFFKQKLYLSVNAVFALIILGIFFWLMIIPFGEWGLFFDGITYSTISRNLAIGLGDFWKPFYTPVVFPTFYEHPPLAFGIQSLFFRMFGEGLWVEKLYTWVVFLAILWTLYQIWSIIFSEKKGFLIVLLFFSLPVVNQDTYRDNLLEVTQTLFVLVAVFFILLAYTKHSYKKSFFIFLMIASFFMIAGFLTKGPNAFFPLVLPAIIGFCGKLFQISPSAQDYNEPINIKSDGILNSNNHQKRKNIYIVGSVLLFFITALTLSVFWLFDGSRNSLNNYLQNQLFASLWGDRKSYNVSRLFFFRFLYIQTIVTVIVFIVWAILCKLTGCWKVNRLNRYYGLLFLLVFFSASLPMVMSQRMAHHYLLPSLPYLALSSAAYLHTSISTQLLLWDRTRLWFRQVRVVAILFFTIVIVFGIWNFGSYSSKDYEVVIKGVDRLGKEHSISQQPITVCKDLLVHWQLIAYAYRMQRIWLIEDETDYFLSDRSCEVDISRYKKIDTLFFDYNLYKKKYNP